MSYDPTPAMVAQIDRVFTPRVASSDQQEQCARIALAFKDLALQIVEATPPGREQATAITKLEEAMSFTVSGVTRGLVKP